MSNDDTPDNVTPMFPGQEGMTRLKGRPYTTPSAAIADVLAMEDFNKTVVDAGWIELRIVAQFGKEGCMFHTVQASRVIMNGPVDPLNAAIAQALPSADVVPFRGVDAPAIYALREMAEANNLPRNHFLNSATVGDMEVLDRELRGATEDEIDVLIDGSEDGIADIVKNKDWAASNAILERLFEETPHE